MLRCYPLHTSGGTFLRLIDDEELRELQNERRVLVVRTRKKGRIRHVEYVKDGLVQVGGFSASKSVFPEHVAEKWYIWSHHHRAFAWNNA